MILKVLTIGSWNKSPSFSMASSGSESFEEVSVHFLIESISIYILSSYFLTFFWQIEFEGAVSDGRISFHTELHSKFECLYPHY
jgi:hypothetical protein